MIVGFDQQIFRTLPPPHELVLKGTPLRGLAGEDGSELRIVFPDDEAEPPARADEAEPPARADEAEPPARADNLTASAGDEAQAPDDEAQTPDDEAQVPDQRR